MLPGLRGWFRRPPVPSVGLAGESVTRPGPLCVRVCAASAWRAFVAGVGLALACVLGGMARGIGGVFGPMGGCLGPWMRRLTPWVAVWAGLPILHLSGPAA